MRNSSQRTLHHIDTGKYYLLARICTFHHFGRDGSHKDVHFSLRKEEEEGEEEEEKDYRGKTFNQYNAIYT